MRRLLILMMALMMAFMLVALASFSMINTTVSYGEETEVGEIIIPIVEVTTCKEFYFVGEFVNLTVKFNLGCFCLVHYWYVCVQDSRNNTVSEWSWAAKVDEEGYREKTLIWVPRKGDNYKILAVLIDHGSGSKEITVFDREYADKWIWTDKEKYKLSELVKILLHNAGNQTLDGYIELYIARYENGTWFLVYKVEIEICSTLIVDSYFYWMPCTIVDWGWDQRDMEGKPVPLGRYRVTWIPHVNGVPISLHTWEYRIASPESPKVYLILVESEICGDVYNEVDKYKRELCNQGVLAYVKTVSREASAESLRSYLNRVYNYYLKCGCDFLGAVFIGDLPYMFFEVQNPSAFILEMNETYKLSFLSREVFPCDLYFEDLDGAWKDSDGNGIIDTHEGDVRPEIFIGRVSPNTFLRSTKINHIKSYFAKELAYLKGEVSARSKALVYIDDDWELWAENWAEACNKAFNETALIYGGWKTNALDYAWRLRESWDGSSFVHVAVHGAPHVHAFGPWGSGIEGILTSLDIGLINPKPLFYLLFSCSNAKYTSKWYIAGQYIWGDSGLLSISSTKVGGMLFYNHFYEPLGKGCCFGESLKHWFTWVLDSKPLGETETKAWFYGMTVIGDPILALKPPLYEEMIANITDVIALYETYSPITAEISELEPFFEVKAENNVIELFQGLTNSTYIMLTTNQSFYSVELEISDAPKGLNVEVRPQIVNLAASKDAQVNITFRASQNLRAGVYCLTILAKGDDTHREEAFSVIVSADTTPPLIDVPSQDPPIGDVEPNQNVTVSVNVTEFESGVQEVILSYSLDEGLTWNNVSMVAAVSFDTSLLYMASIPGMPPRTTVHYKIIAYDNAGNFAVSDKAGQYYVYTVVPEFSNWLLILLMLLAASLLAVSLSSRAKTERNP